MRAGESSRKPVNFDLSILCSEHGLRECGVRVPDCAAYVARIESETREAVSEWWPGSAVDYVTAHTLALMWGESRLNRCGVGPGGRKVLGLVGNPHKFTEAEVRAAMAKQPRSARVDLGPGQILYRYARSPDGGNASLDELIGRETAVRTVVWNLHTRRKGGRDPWGFWPGNRWNEDYTRKVARLARRILGGAK